MDELWLIGIGMGSRDHLTRQGEAAIRAADVILIPQKGEEKTDLAEMRLSLCREVLDGDLSKVIPFDLPTRDTSGDYQTGVSNWHDAIATAWTGVLPETPGRVALLVWGDPSLYDSTLRIAARLEPRPAVKVVPGITALQALTAAHAIPLNEINAPVLLTTGRQLRENGWPDGADTVAVMLDGDCSFQRLDPDGITIWWGAFLGLPNEVLRHGPLAEVGAEIIATRQSARTAHGWIMDTYLLKRAPAAHTIFAPASGSRGASGGDI